MATRGASPLAFGNALYSLLNEVKASRQGDEGRLLFEHHTRQEVADRLGVSTRTLRRWINQGTPPSKAHAATVLHQGDLAKRRIKRAGGIVVNGQAVSGHRKQLIDWQMVSGKPRDTGKRYPSDWTNYDVSRLNKWGVFEVAKKLRDEFGYIQFIYEIRHGDGSKYYGDGCHASTTGLFVEGVSDERLLQLIESILWQYMEMHGYDEDDEDDIAAAKMAGWRENKILYIGANPRAIPENRKEYGGKY